MPSGPRSDPDTSQDQELGAKLVGPDASARASGRAPSHARSAEVIDFVHRWYAYGGGSDYDIFVQFGLTADVFFRRAARLLRDEGRRDLPPSTVAAMREVCRMRLGGGRKP